MPRAAESGHDRSVEVWAPKNGELVVHSHLIEVDEIKDAIHSTTYRPSKRASALAGLALDGVLNASSTDPADKRSTVLATLVLNPDNPDPLSGADWV